MSGEDSTSAQKPWEETWTAPPRSDCVVNAAADECVAHCLGDEERAVFISAAPDMYRALKSVEFSGSRLGELACPSCDAPVEGDPAYGQCSIEHAADCALDTALRKARGEP